MLECRAKVWTALPCKGRGGCQRSNATVTCDMSANLEGDNCPSRDDGRTLGLCAADGRSTLVCKDGKLAKADLCKSCKVENNIVRCVPL